ncbi:MAG: membrane protein insertase YidC [Pseudomonadota bacterium]
MQNENTKNILLASILSAVILISWTWFYEKPRLEARKVQPAAQIEVANDALVTQKPQNSSHQNPNLLAKAPESNSQNVDQILPKEEIIADSKNQRVQIKTPELEGSINLKGLMFDDLTLVNYQEALDPKSKEVTLLSPNGSANQYQVNFGYKVLDQSILTPNQDSIWKANGKVLTPNNPVTFSWQNKQKITFEITVAIDEHYMFSISQAIKNNSGQKLEGFTTANIERLLPQIHSSSYVLHEGPIGVFDGILKEKSYTNLRDKKDDNDFKAQTGWFGITDKYWLVSIIPDKKTSFETQFSYDGSNQNNFYKADSKTQKFAVENGNEISLTSKMFAGAKRVSLLDQYSKDYDIALFDRAVDFGWYYFLTKPFFFILQFFNKIFGNYGLAILAITVVVKLAMFPLANKSYTAIARIKKLQPKIDKIREEFKDKKMQMNKEIMQLYKREKVNPVSGCLPMLIQIPVFFSLYKVLYLTIDMRHAPFYGWIKDLSAPDPTSIFNLFGLLPFDVHGIISIGLWPIFMGITMIIQQKLNPQPTDPAQAKVMKILPFILIFAFAPFPAGLLIYWTWSNSLSILQQWFITKRLAK